MFYYDKVDVFEGIELIRQENQKSVIFPTLFLNKRFNFQSYVCSICHDLVKMSMNHRDVAISNIKGTDYYSIISEIMKYKIHYQT